MLQALIKQGKVQAEEVAAPVVSPGCVLVQVVSSCISVGTEMSGVQASGKSLIRRALEQPEKVAVALRMVKDRGLSYTVQKIKGHFDAGQPTGYSAAGVVLGVGEGVTDLRVGQNVAAAGAGYANHAQFIDVPRNLVCPMPEGLDFQSAGTVTLGSISLQGVRRAQPQLGEIVVVVGTGILGLLCMQMLKASGARVIAVDLDPQRLEIAKKLGAELALNARSSNLLETIANHTEGKLADCVLFCAATNESSTLSQAFSMLRRKGRMVMVGVWGNELKREDIYAKELDFCISCSYGPGRYDPTYEEQGLDYPYAYVRWTENRNMQEYLRLLQTSALSLAEFSPVSYPIEQVEAAYSALNSQNKPLLVTLEYGEDIPKPHLGARIPKVFPTRTTASVTKGKVRIGLIGAGDYATGMHLPNIKKLDTLFSLQAVCSRKGAKAKAIADQFQAAYSCTDVSEILRDPDIDAVVIATRHNLHGKQTLEALHAGKHVLVEKPLALTEEDIAGIEAVYAAAGEKPLLCVGFNRRFSKYAKACKEFCSPAPLFMRYRMNAGFLPAEHWVHGAEGGGRITGEACHIIDLFRYLADSPVQSVSVARMGAKAPYLATDNKIVTLEYENGSVGSISYFACGSKDLSKEYLEIHCQGRSVIMDNYQKLQGVGCTMPNLHDAQPDKGQLELLKAFGLAISQGGPWPISLGEILETSYLSIYAQGT